MESFNSTDGWYDGRPVVSGSTPQNRSSARSRPPTKTSITRTGLSSQIQSSRHSGKSVLCPRSIPSTKRLIRSLRKSRSNHTARITSTRVFLHSQGQLPSSRTLSRTSARIRTIACTLYASPLADEKCERNCVALEAVTSRPEIQCRGEGAGCYSGQVYRGRASGFQGAEPTGLPPHSTHWCRHGLAEPEPPIILKGSPCDLRGFGSCERQVRRREPTEPEYVNPFHREVPKP